MKSLEFSIFVLAFLVKGAILDHSYQYGNACQSQQQIKEYFDRFVTQD